MSWSSELEQSLFRSFCFEEHGQVRISFFRNEVPVSITISRSDFPAGLNWVLYQWEDGYSSLDLGAESPWFFALATLMGFKSRTVNGVLKEAYVGQLVPGSYPDTEKVILAYQSMAPAGEVMGVLGAHKTLSSGILSLVRHANWEISQEKCEALIAANQGVLRSSSIPYKTEELRSHLFDKLGLEPVSYTDGGKGSVSEEALRALAPLHPDARQALQLRQLSYQSLRLERFLASASAVTSYRWPDSSSSWLRSIPLSWQDLAHDLDVVSVEHKVAVRLQFPLATAQFVLAEVGDPALSEAWDDLAIMEILKVSDLQAMESKFMECLFLAASVPGLRLVDMDTEDMLLGEVAGRLFAAYPSLPNWLDELLAFHERSRSVLVRGCKFPVVFSATANPSEVLGGWVVANWNFLQMQIASRLAEMRSVAFFPYLDSLYVQCEESDLPEIVEALESMPEIEAVFCSPL